MFRRTLQASQRKSRSNARRATAGGPPRRRTVLFEPLEPRLLLSAYPLTAAPISLPLDDSPVDMCAVCQEYLRSVDLSELQESPSVAARDPASVASGDPVIDQESRLDLGAMQPVSGDVSTLAGQVIYLDLDGAYDVTYEGPVRVEGIEVPAFRGPGALGGKESEIQTALLDSLNTSFADLGVTFTTSRPDGAAEYSTIYIGGDGAAFAEAGSFYGLAEQVDVANRDRGDNAFVFADQLASFSVDETSYRVALADLVGHEARHLLGFAHQAEGEDGLARVAAVTLTGAPLWQAEGPAPVGAD